MQQPSQQSQPPNKYRLPEGLNAAQIAQIQVAVQDVLAQLKLRQWCIEKALACSSTDPVPLATAIYNFVMPAPAAEENNQGEAN